MSQNSYTNPQQRVNSKPAATTEIAWSADEKSKINQIITGDADGKVLVDFAEYVGKKLVHDGMTTSQIRNIFSEARQIESNWTKNPKKAKLRLNLLKPKMAYQKAREEKTKYLALVLTEAIDRTLAVPESEADQAFQKFMNFFEAILAYHQSNGGKRK